MTTEEIKSILDEHGKWLRNESGGKRANLSRAYLSGAYLSGANLSGANLSGAYLSGADLSGAYLSGANLSGAYLSGADLSGADLSGADLYWADLSGAKIGFIRFPSIKMLASFELGKLSDKLTLELMRRDAWAHPHPKAFDKWAKGGDCPYKNEDRFWIFELRKNLWRKGKPQMRDSDLIIAICKEKGWKVKGYIA